MERLNVITGKMVTIDFVLEMMERNNMKLLTGKGKVIGVIKGLDVLEDGRLVIGHGAGVEGG